MQKKSLGKVTKIILAIILVAAVCLAGWMVFSGRLYVGLKDPSQKIITPYAVCTNEDINNYNEFIKNIADDFEEKVNQIETRIVKKSGYEKDINCLFILASANATTGNSIKVKKYATKIKELDNNDNYVSSLFDNFTSADNLLAATER